MPLYNLPTQPPILFIHIPKVAGTTVEFAMEKYFLGFLDRTFSGLFFPCSPQHFHREILENILDRSLCERSFTVVRHPLKRFISEYKFQRRYFNLNDNFESWANSTIEKYKSDKYIFDNHIRPQNEFPFPRTKVFKLENGLVELSDFLKDKHNIEVNFGNMKEMNSGELEVEFSKSLLTKIEDFYHADFEKFNY